MAASYQPSAISHFEGKIMAQQFEADYIFGIHEPGGEGHMLNAGRPGWIVFTEEIGYDPNRQDGRDYRAYSD